MRVVFVHPDLGIGGAERLVVDGAVGLRQRGHHVSFYTAHHDPAHCFPETADGSIPVHVHGAWIPRSIFGRFLAVMAYLRCIYIALYLVLMRVPADVYVADQVSAVVPVLRLSGVRVFFYCHFPDLLLSQRTSRLKACYRAPIDYVEHVTTAMADTIAVNSKFTQAIALQTFPRLRQRTLTVLHPPVNLAKFDHERPEPPAELAGTAALRALTGAPGTPVFLSVNRYERKKNVGLAIEALQALVCDAGAPLAARAALLIVAGGYDERVRENVEHFDELRQLALRAGMAERVLFLRSPSDAAKTWLLLHCTAVLYTPDREHFGIVPVEAMYNRCPVVAVASGGPLESVVHGTTGFLCANTPGAFAAHMSQLATDAALRRRLAEAGRAHAAAQFGLDSFAERLEAELLRLCVPARTRRT